MEQVYPKRNKGFSGQAIRLAAISTMLCDHIWVTIAQEYSWLTYIGRIAFPLFAFLIVEGFYHTTSRSAYLVRILLLAAISEIPFDLMRSGKLVDPGSQNVLWTLAFGLLAIIAVHFIKTRIDNVVVTGAATVAAAAFAMYLADALLTDYYGYGVLTVLLFYIMRDLRYERLGQLFGLLLINVVWMSGAVVTWHIGQAALTFPIQSFALISLFLIWKYNGARGMDNTILRFMSYAFYPLHMLILALMAMNGVALG
jgi:hypothetical protein